MMVKELIRKIFKSNDTYLILFSILAGAVFFFVPIFADDVVNIQWVGTTIGDAWQWSIDSYFRWSSRLFIYFIGAIILQKGVIALGIYMIISFYVLLKALVMLFPKVKHRLVMPFLFAIVMVFPYSTQNTAGWIATLTSYFGPHAFAVMALVPIKKAINNERINWLSFLFYSVCLIYGANVEQMSIVMVAAYAICCIYLFYRKRVSITVIFFLLLSIASFVNIFVCPGNQNRSVLEESRWFATYSMLDIVDKADIGISTTLKWLFTDNNLIVFFCFIISILVWAKYREILYRTISLIPIVSAALLGPLKPLTAKFLPYAVRLSEDVDYYGAFTVASQGRGSGMVQFGFFLFLALCILVELVLLDENIVDLLIDLTLMFAGFASRAMMGFSPTIYASGSRTFTTLMICIIIIGVHVYSSYFNYLDNNSTVRTEKYACFYWIVSLFGLIDLAYLV